MSLVRPLRSGALAISILLALGLPVSAVLAQQATTPVKSAPKKVVELPAINVTATKRVENVQKVPMSITVLTPEKIQAFVQADNTVLQLASRSPSLYVETSYGRALPRFYIRGLGNSDFDLNASQPVSLVYDDIVQENPVLKGFPMFDLAQIEVLRGPQGTLFGRNSPAGVVKFESVRPSQVTSGYGRVSYGSYGTTSAEAAIGGALSPHWSGRVSMLAEHRDNWIDNTFTGEKNALGFFNDSAVRLQALYEVEDFSALINVHARILRGTAQVNYANAIEPGTDHLVPGFKRDQVAQDGLNNQRLFSWGSNLHLNWNLGDYTFTSITGLERATTYSRGDVDGGYGAGFHPPMGPGFIPFPSETADALPRDRQLTQEFRLASNRADKLKWQVGTYYFDEDIQITNFSYATFNNHALEGYATQTQHTKASAVFGSSSYQLADDFEVSAGARWSHDSRNFAVDRLLSPFGAGPLRLTAQPHDSRLSGDLTGTWTLSPTVNVYARIANGFRAPSVQGRVLFADGISQARTETVTSYEFGIKSTGMENRLRFNADVFTYNMHNQQLTAVGGASNVTQLINARRTEGYGAEFDLEAYLTPHLIVTAGGSYNHTRLKDPGLSVAVCGAACTVRDPLDSAGNALIDGNSLPNAPKWIGTITARYGIPYGDTGEFFASTDWDYRSEVHFMLYNSAEFRGEPLLKGGLRLGYNWSFGKREVALYARNLTNKRAITGGIDFNNLTGFVNDPRVVGVEFRAEL